MWNHQWKAKKITYSTMLPYRTLLTGFRKRITPILWARKLKVGLLLLLPSNQWYVIPGISNLNPRESGSISNWESQFSWIKIRIQLLRIRHEIKLGCRQCVSPAWVDASFQRPIHPFRRPRRPFYSQMKELFKSLEPEVKALKSV